jgi:hypothetical protein
MEKWKDRSAPVFYFQINWLSAEIRFNTPADRAEVLAAGQLINCRSV